MRSCARFPVIGVDYGYLWSRAAECVDGERYEILGEHPPDGVRESSAVMCGRCSADRWLFGHFCPSKNNVRNRNALEKELTSGGDPRTVVRSDGEPSNMAHIWASPARAESREWIG